MTSPRISLAFHGTAIHSSSVSSIEILENTLITVDQQGKITNCIRPISAHEVPSTLAHLDPSFPAPSVRYITFPSFLIPGFVDTHNHAPQYLQRGLGQGMHILDWLSAMTFPNEARFADPVYAQRLYARAVSAFLKQGITCASYYSSLHGPATRHLAEACLAQGQRALVGKCNMDRNSPPTYIEPSVEASLAETKACIEHIRHIDPIGSMVRPVLTPRFAISCTAPLLSGLGDLATSDPSLAIQTHFNEAQQEVDATLSLFPEFSTEAQLYEHFNLLGPRTILAHCTVMSPDDGTGEMATLKRLECGIAHCPIANTSVGGGFMAAPIRTFLDKGIKVGLGTDSGGGWSSSILDAIRMAIVVSNAREVQSGGVEKALSPDEVFYLATLGGARVVGLGDTVGKFEVGREFDALIVRPNEVLSKEGEVVSEANGVMTPVETDESWRSIWEKFLVSGDDRNIVEVFVKGRCVKAST
ncbi:Guanine deaminase [Cyphellophora attinorum]|uniref:Probable guanine deaminase n=1 Tax=Cyphellophora attinorum TaxID=1664694 RepID=A0A0N1I1D9_9EURO|nr:Guanine deaminase [Phialophora attinorum]KPI45645.1 Guanine deaminase [Phialophora attinorum]